MGFVRKLQLSSFQRPPLSFSTMFEACTIGSRMQCGIFQPDCKNLQKKFYEVGSQVQDFNFTQFWTPWVGTIWIRLNWLGSFTLGLQPPAAPCGEDLSGIHAAVNQTGNENDVFLLLLGKKRGIPCQYKVCKSSCSLLSQGGLKMIKYWTPAILTWLVGILITQTHLLSIDGNAAGKMSQTFQ